MIFASRARSIQSLLGPALAAVVCAIVLTALAVPSVAGAADRRSTHTSAIRTTSDVHYAVNQSLCAQPSSPTGYTCDVLRRVPVAKGTPGAYAYSLPATRRGPAGGLTPADLAKAYGFNPNVNRRHQTVALVNWYDDPHALSDLDSFDRHYGFAQETARSFRKVNQSGATSPLPAVSRESASETALDIETVRSVCHTCQILLVEAKGPTDNDLATAENTAARLGATEISNSFGSVEHAVSPFVRSAFNHPGIVITASTGDDGWDGWDVVNSKYRSPGAASYPASDPHVIAVGGTTLTLTSSGTRARESVWNSNGLDDSTGQDYGYPLGASGGGCSTLFAAPAWQRNEAGYSAAGCSGKRLAADVSADADPMTGFDVLNTFAPANYPDWITAGGTSLSSPLVAAMYALAGGSGGSAYPAASLYLNSSKHPGSHYDVTTGGNGYCDGDTTAHCSAAVLASRHSTDNPNGFGSGNTDCSFPRNGSTVATQSAPALSSECNAVAGFDGASGVGTPTSPALFRASNPTVTVTHPLRPRAHKSYWFTAKTTERLSGLHPVSFQWDFGDGASSTSRFAGMHHTYAHPGSYTVRLWVVDSSGQATVSRVVEKVS